jgi:hypothetical protein
MARVGGLLRAAVATVLIAVVAGAAAQDIKLLPVDEAASDASWLRFKARLLDALGRRDQKFVISIVVGKIRNISDTDGIAEFRKLWELNSANSPLWVELPKILFLGGAYVKRDKGVTEFCGPYVHYKWPDDAPANATGAIIAREVLVKTAPSADAGTLQTLSHDLVNVIDWEVADDSKDNRQPWVKIQTKAGAGFVPDEQIRSPLEYRACFVKSGASWRMTGFEVGE